MFLLNPRVPVLLVSFLHSQKLIIVTPSSGCPQRAGHPQTPVIFLTSLSTVLSELDFVFRWSARRLSERPHSNSKLKTRDDKGLSREQAHRSCSGRVPVDGTL